MTMTTAIGWRIFDVGDDGALIPPFVRRYWTEHEQPRDVWRGAAFLDLLTAQNRQR